MAGHRQFLSDVAVTQPRPGAAVVECRGEHDVSTRDQLGSLVEALMADNELVVIDVSEATFIDSSFLHLLVQADRQSRQRGSTMRLQHSTAPIVAKVLEVSGLMDVLDIATTRDEALAPVSSPSFETDG